MVDLARVEARESLEISCRSDELEKLFVEWLNALIIEKDSKGLVFSRFEMEPIREVDQSYELRAKVWGEPFDPGRHESKVDVKAATYAGLTCERTAEGYRLECVVDI
jgi:SHS2 domain-containing protein